jgi:sulfide dehydrogenase cytochrome subunit
MKKQLLITILSGSLLIPTALIAADGAGIAKEQCVSCHGKDGNSTASKVPSIAGFSKAGLIEMLQAYKAGDRKGDSYKAKGEKATDMNAVIKDMSAADIDAVSAFFASKKFKPAKQSFDAALAKTGADIHEKSCEKCHSEQGKSSEDDTAILAGQWKPYLKKEFSKFSSGSRDMSKKMKKKFSPLSNEEKAALLEFYASLQ